MVTFSIPGDDDVAEVANGTPKPRPPLPFAKRTFAASPFAGGSSKRHGTPQTAPTRKFMLGTHDDNPPSGLSNSSIATARNIFRESTFSDSPPSTAFSPSLPHGAMKKVFAPGATPESTRTFRQSTAQATPRGMAAKATDKELFPMRISSPPPELSGEVLTQKIPKEWNSKGSIYADQFLAHLCPPGLDEEQRRQFFCILDLRRLKYAANEIFSRKDWKLNVINFAKEFEKSRSIILLRYGLYEFQNVKPSKEVLKRWRREHGLPEPEEEEVPPTPSKMASMKKRKASDDLSKDSAAASRSMLKGKRRAMEEEETVATPAPSKNKRKASVSEEQPSKLQKPAPSSAKSLFEKIANKPTSAAQASQTPASSRVNLFGAKTSTSSNLARSVFTNSKALGGQGGAPAGSNIFGYLSDASSAKNSGVEADVESESETGSEEASPGEGQSDERSVAASGTGEAGSQAGSSFFAKQPASLTSGSGPGLSSNPGTRESTPGRSLFERVTKDNEGQPVRAEKSADSLNDKPAAPRDQTWNPSTTPIKFASSTPASAAPAGSVFAPKSTTTTNFGTAGQETSSAKALSAGASAEEGAKEGCESDKENESQPSRKSPFEPKAPAAQPSLGSSLFQPKSTPTETPQGSEVPKQSSNMFGSTANNDSKPEAAPATTNMFGTLAKASGATSATTPPVQSGYTFGAKPVQSDKSAESEAAPKAGPLFGGISAPSTLGNTGTASSVFGVNKPASNPASGPGSGASTPSASLFGASSAQPSGSAAAKTNDAALSSTGPPSHPQFGFGSASNAEDGKPSSGTEATPSKPLFGGAPKSPSSGAIGNSLFSGSPMKQDEPSPAKKAFAGASGAGSSAPVFSFGNPQAATSSAPSSSSIFGGAPAPAASNAGNGSDPFGAATPSNAGSGGFSFNFGGAGASGSSFNNPFAKTSNTASGAPSGGGFSFGGASSGPTGGSSTSFQFGAGAAAQAATNAAPAFGGASTPGGAPVFNFSGPPSQPSQGSGTMFGSSQAVPALGGLQPPAGGSSTTGTNSPLNLGGGGSSLATTPAAGTPEPWNQAEGTTGGDHEGGDKHEQINLTDGVDVNEEIVHEVRAKALKFVPPADSDGKGKSKSPWSTQGIGPLRLLKHEETGMVRLVLRAEPRGHVALNRAVLPNMPYKADEKYVKITTSNEDGDGLETWMVQVKTKDMAKELAEALEKNKELNKQ
ncbi:ranBP1 domain-containing protein [Hirsutella rhossiliensis]|uniref:RanBP1 domain-containing protein n=1 Tax=Hirsutella rhossiliensis TaxID=111463 RepID=A0A9P8NAM0_9HYPO|nr:ranBP1 domain-containing protein [Hirsutella rhossiliensis]KAH0967647.1 ranBP1 domain-containing protein [Hirsutella rhossiliensis]